jgi:hypothetical protein
MKKIITDWEWLSLRIITLFALAMLISFTPDLLRGFFGDELYVPQGVFSSNSSGFFDNKWVWGFRHYLYFWMCIILFIIQSVRINKWLEKKSKNPNSFPV